MERLSSSDSGGAEEAGDPDRIPAAVFERDPSESNKDWSMMSTESVFGLQVAPSSDFTGFFLAHPELMDIATPPRSSSAAAVLDADAKATPVILPPFESIPELPESAMKGNYSFAFPKYYADRHHFVPYRISSSCLKAGSSRQTDEQNLMAQLDRGQEELLREAVSAGTPAGASSTNGGGQGHASTGAS
jgi:hypothetical protein